MKIISKELLVFDREEDKKIRDFMELINQLFEDSNDKEIIDACQQIIDAVELLNFKSEELYQFLPTQT